MNAPPLLRRELVVVPLEAETVVDALGVLASRLEKAGLLAQPATVGNALALHAARAAVRAGPDVVLPHYRTSAVASVVVCLGIARTPLRTDDPEWDPGPRIVALVLAPPDATTTYLQTVSTLASVLRQTSITRRICEARDADAVFELPALSELEIKPKLTVRDIMAPVQDTVTPDTTVRAAVDLLLRAGAHSLVVVGEKGEVLGMVSDADITRGLVLNRARPAEAAVLPPLDVRDVMSRAVMCTADRTGLDEVANLMISKDVGEVPVVAEGRLTGIVRRGDILRTLYGRQKMSLTLAIIKPDATRRNLAGRILAHLEDAGFRLRATRVMRLSEAQAREFYAVHRDRPFYESLVAFMTSGPCVPVVLEREDAVASLRTAIGATDPAEADAGTIRAIHAESKERNAIHASDSDENAVREIAFFFAMADFLGSSASA